MKDFYPPDWPRCVVCGDPALEGHITCGRMECAEGEARKQHFDAALSAAVAIARERGEAQEALALALRNNQRLSEHLAAQRRYIEALERQLEPSVIEEIKDELSALDGP